MGSAAPAPEIVPEIAIVEITDDAIYAVTVPTDWRKGALLNVRNHGAQYIVTLHPAEYDPRHEDQCMKFTNVGECQDFVSAWYQREHSDPRAR